MRLDALSIRQRLVAMQMLIAAVVVVLVSIFHVLNDVRVRRESARARLASMASVIAYNCASALVFADREAAATTLAALESERRVSHAWVLDAGDEPFASYRRAGLGAVAAPRLGGDGEEVAVAHLTVARPVVHRGDRLGAVAIRYDLERFGSLVLPASLAAGLALLVALVIGFALSLRIQRGVSDPILALVRTSRRVADSHDLSLRMPEGRADELGVLYRGFNAMLTELEAREQARRRAEDEIRRLNETLEQRVADRTAELAAANARLIELDRLKSMFLASMSHELRTPLNSILGFTGLMLMGMAGPLNEEQTKQLSLVQSGANHLLNLINDILDISKIEAGRVDLEVKPFAMDAVVDEVIAAVRPMAEAKGLELLRQVTPGLVVESDARRVKQVLMNLVGNAIKFSARGAVTVEVGADAGQVRAGVSDQGIGIREEDLPRLFNPFEQVDMSSTKRYEGTGLGLYLCRKIMLLLHGTIAARSVHGQGSTFSFTLPVRWQGGPA